jgi:putative selenium metabolism protein SsnA
VTRLALAGGTVVASGSPPRLASGDVVLEDGRVASVGGAVAPGVERIDCSGCVVIPGNVCAHHHLYASLARGMPYGLEPPASFLEILRRVWWRLDRALDPDAVQLSAWAGGADALLAGTTTIVDHHASPNAVAGSLGRVAASLDGLGVRSVLCYEVSDRDGLEAAAAGIEENRRFLKEGIGSLVRGMVGAHASFTLSEDTLAACVDVARSESVGLHIHVAEDGVDQRDALDRFGRRVVLRLEQAGALDERALLAHCIHLDEAELAAVRASGATAVHNPRSNMNNGVGHAPVERFDRLALGTDGIGGDLFEESRVAYWRAREDDPAASPQWALDRLGRSARVAAAAFDEPLLGRIQPGAPADLAVLDYEPPTPLTEENLAAHWVFGMSGRNVRDVLVNGVEVVRDRRLVRPGPDGPSARARAAAEALWRRMEDVPEHPFVPAGGA